MASGSHRRTAAAPRSHGRPGEKHSPLRLAWDATMACRAGVVHILKDSCFVVAALLFPDMEQDPAIDAGAHRSNVHTPMSHGQPDEPARLGRCQQGLQALNIGALTPGGFPVGLRRRLVSPCPTTGKPDAPPALPPMAPASGPKPQRSSPTVAPVPIPKGVPQ